MRINLKWNIPQECQRMSKFLYCKIAFLLKVLMMGLVVKEFQKVQGNKRFRYLYCH